MFPKIGGKPPKWMVKIMKSHIKMDDLGGFPITHIATNLHLGSSIPGATMILANLVAALAIGDGIR